LYEIKGYVKKMINILLVEDDELDVVNMERVFKKVKVTNPLFVATNKIEILAIMRN
jgi:hypothetical protein